MRLAGASNQEIERYRGDQSYRLERKIQDHLIALQAGATVRHLLVRGAPAPVLVEQAERWGADLIVVGKHGRSVCDERLLGSVTQNVLYYGAGCNMLIGAMTIRKENHHAPAKLACAAQRRSPRGAED